MTVPHVLRSFAFLGWTLQAALDLPAANEARRRQVAELWCGIGSIWRAGAEMGYEAIGYDKARLPGVTDSERRSTMRGYHHAIGFLKCHSYRLVPCPWWSALARDRMLVHGVGE